MAGEHAGFAGERPGPPAPAPVDGPCALSCDGRASGAVGAGVEADLGSGVGVTTRLAEAVLRSGVALERPAVELAVARMASEHAPLADVEVLRRVTDDLVGLGPLAALLDDPDVTDVLVNGPDEIWVDGREGLRQSSATFADEGEIIAVVERAITPLGLRIDRSSPIVDARLPDGSRLHAVIPPATPGSPIVAIRRFTESVADLGALVEAGSCSVAHAEALRDVVEGRRNILVSGGTGTGKTTLLNVLSRLIPGSQRTVIIEDAAELRPSGHHVRLEARPSNAEGVGAIPLDTLIQAALRLRPDRIVVGEVRGPEALDLVNALNTGHEGSMSTIHANGPDEALVRLETLAMSGHRRPSVDAVRRQIDAAVDVVVQLRRCGSRRSVSEVRLRR